MNNWIPEEVRVADLSNDLQELYKNLQEKFNNAWITDPVGVRIATILGDEATIWRFLKANSWLSYDNLERLHTALWSPQAKVFNIIKNDSWVHAKSTWEN